MVKDIYIEYSTPYQVDKVMVMVPSTKKGENRDFIPIESTKHAFGLFKVPNNRFSQKKKQTKKKILVKKALIS